MVGFATEVVNNGERLPLLKEETVPPPPRLSHVFTLPRFDTKAVSPCSNLIFAPPQIVGCAAAPNEIRAKKRIMMFFMCVRCAYRLSTNQTPVPPENRHVQSIAIFPKIIFVKDPS